MAIFRGDALNDSWVATAAEDSYIGGGGSDAVDYRNSDRGVWVSLVSGEGQRGHADGDSYSGIENIYGSEFNDRLTGRGNANELRGSAGDDSIYGNAGNDVLLGGDGEDTLGRLLDGPDEDTDPDMTNDAGNDVMRGNAGNDTLYGGDGADTLQGGADDDAVMGEAGNDMLWGGAGNDQVDGGEGNDTGWGNAGADAVNGDAGNDRLGGGRGNDTVQGGAGNDVQWGGNDNDVVQGGAGNDQLRGGSGADVVEGGDGADMIWGGAGADFLYGSGTTRSDAGVVTVTDDNDGDGLDNDRAADVAAAGSDTIAAVMDDDDPDEAVYDADTVAYVDSNAAVKVNLASLKSYDGADQQPGTPDDAAVPDGDIFATVSGGYAEGDWITGFEHVRGSHYDDELTGDANVNKIQGHRGDDTIKGGAEDDVLWGGGGDDKIDGDAGNDSIIGGDGDDDIDGGAGDDTIEVSAGSDTIDGGAGDDTLSFAGASAGVTVSLTGRADSDGYLTILGDKVKNDVENLTGTAHDDTLTGNSGANVLSGGAGDDTLDGMAGADTLVGGAGDDTYMLEVTADDGTVGDTVTEAATGGGSDTLMYVLARGATAGVGRSGSLVDAPANLERIVGTDQDDFINLVTNYDGGADQPGVTVEMGDGTGNVGQRVNGGDGPDTILGGDSWDVVFAGGGNDSLVGGAGLNQLYGQDGNDTLTSTSLATTGTGTLDGGPGNDTITGGANADSITGGDGNDVINAGAGADTIVGGAGDTITGGPGADVFDINDVDDAVAGDQDNEILTIMDFTAGEQVDVRGLTLNNASGVATPVNAALMDEAIAAREVTADGVVFSFNEMKIVLVGYDHTHTFDAGSATTDDFLTA